MSKYEQRSLAMFMVKNYLVSFRFRFSPWKVLDVCYLDDFKIFHWNFIQNLFMCFENFWFITCTSLLLRASIKEKNILINLFHFTPLKFFSNRSSVFGLFFGHLFKKYIKLNILTTDYIKVFVFLDPRSSVPWFLSFHTNVSIFLSLPLLLS